MQKRDAVYRAAARQHLFTADDVLRFPVATFDQNIGMAGEHKIQRRVFLEQHYQADCLQRGQHCHAVLFGVDWAVVAFAQAFNRGITIYTEDE